MFELIFEIVGGAKLLSYPLFHGSETTAARLISSANLYRASRVHVDLLCVPVCPWELHAPLETLESDVTSPSRERRDAPLAIGTMQRDTTS